MNLYLFSAWPKLLIGTAEGGIKAWNVDAKRVVCDLSTGPTFRRSFLDKEHILNLWFFIIVPCSEIGFAAYRVLDVKCSPVESIFVSAAASEGYTSSIVVIVYYFLLTERSNWYVFLKGLKQFHIRHISSHLKNWVEHVFWRRKKI